MSIREMALTCDDDGMFIVIDGKRILSRGENKDGESAWNVVAKGWRVIGGVGEGQMPTMIIAPNGDELVCALDGDSLAEH